MQTQRGLSGGQGGFEVGDAGVSGVIGGNIVIFRVGGKSRSSVEVQEGWRPYEAFGDRRAGEVENTAGLMQGDFCKAPSPLAYIFISFHKKNRRGEIG